MYKNITYSQFVRINELNKSHDKRIISVKISENDEKNVFAKKNPKALILSENIGRKYIENIVEDVMEGEYALSNPEIIENIFINKDLVIVGTGGFAREVRWLIEECNKACISNWNIKGWISNEEAIGSMIDGLPVFGNDDYMLSIKKPINVVIAIGDGNIRERIYSEYSRNKNIEYPNIIAPNVIMSDSVKIGKGCIIAHSNILTVNIEIGDFFIDNLLCTVGHDCIIKDFVTIYPGAHISGGVVLNKGVSVGTGANILQYLSVEENTFVGAGATVISNIQSNCIAVGVPAREKFKIAN